MTAIIHTPVSKPFTLLCPFCFFPHSCLNYSKEMDRIPRRENNIHVCKNCLKLFEGDYPHA